MFKIKQSNSNCAEELQMWNPHVYLLEGKLRKSTPLSAGYDLFATESALIPIGGRGVIATGVKTEMVAGVVGLIQDRSGLAVNNGITVLAGVIDGDYTQEWKVILLNTGNYPFVVNAGDRIAQVVFVNHLPVVASLNAELELKWEQREGGFGSTGK